MSETKRIKADKIEEAYGASGLGVVRGRYFTDDKECGCALTAYALAFCSADIDTPSKVWEAMRNVGFSSYYLSGFTDGFDWSEDKILPRYGRIGITGFSDGRAAWEKMKDREVVR